MKRGLLRFALLFTCSGPTFAQGAPVSSVLEPPTGDLVINISGPSGKVTIQGSVWVRPVTRQIPQSSASDPGRKTHEDSISRRPARTRRRYSEAEIEERMRRAGIVPVRNGVARASHLRAGSYELEARPYFTLRHLHLCDALVVCDVRAGEVTEVDVRLEVGGNLDLSVKDEAGEYVEGAAVYLRDVDGVEVGLSYDETKAGVLLFDPIKPGKYWLEVTKESKQRFRSEVELRAGEDTVVEVVMKSAE
jgi:hypothetical protein